MNALQVIFGRGIFWLSWPILRIILHGSLRTRIVIESDGEALLLRGWYDGNNWSLPGGGVHKNESTKQSAIREVAEETGIKLTEPQLVDLGRDTYDKAGLKFDIQRYGCRLKTKPHTQKQRSEIIALEWFSLTNLQKNMVGEDTWRHLGVWKEHR